MKLNGRRWWYLGFYWAPTHCWPGNRSPRKVDCSSPAKISSHDAMPQRTVLLVEPFLHIGCNVFSGGTPLQGLLGQHCGVVEHVLGHTETLDSHSHLPVRWTRNGQHRLRRWRSLWFCALILPHLDVSSLSSAAEKCRHCGGCVKLRTRLPAYFGAQQANPDSRMRGLCVVVVDAVAVAAGQTAFVCAWGHSLGAQEGSELTEGLIEFYRCTLWALWGNIYVLFPTSVFTSVIYET